MRHLFIVLFGVGLFSIFSPFAQAQGEKKYPDRRDLTREQRIYYLTEHGEQILPDANQAFKRSDYSQALMLCDAYGIWGGATTTGKSEMIKLQGKAEKCYDMTREMKELLAKGNISEAKRIANEILKLNPLDKTAQETSKREDVPVEVDTVKKPVAVSKVEFVSIPKNLTVGKAYNLVAKIFPENADDKKVTWSSDSPSIARVSPDGVVTAVSPGKVTITVTTHDGNLTSTCIIIIVKPEEKPEEKPEIRVVSNNNDRKSEKRVPHTAFFVEAGVGLSGKSVSPELAVGVLDIASSRIGAEVSGSYDFNGIYGVDLAALVRITSFIYVRPIVGFISERNYSTTGLCGGLGLNFIIGKHFCIDVSAKYCPEIKASIDHKVNTAGAYYNFPVVSTLRGACIAPSLRVGWAF